MNDHLNQIFSEFEKNQQGASSNEISKLQDYFHNLLPLDYMEILQEFDGGEGEIGENGYLILFSTSEVKSANEDYSLLMEQIPDYVLIGKDAADTGYAIHKGFGTYHSFGLMSDFRTDKIKLCGSSFEEFVQSIS